MRPRTSDKFVRMSSSSQPTRDSSALTRDSNDDRSTLRPLAVTLPEAATAPTPVSVTVTFLPGQASDLALNSQARIRLVGEGRPKPMRNL